MGVIAEWNVREAARCPCLVILCPVATCCLKRMTSVFSVLRSLSLLPVTLGDGCKISEKSLALSSAFVLALDPSYVSSYIHPTS